MSYTQSLTRVASWVIRNKETKQVIMETFDKAKVKALNTAQYEAVPILDYLQELNTRAYHLVLVDKPEVKATAYPATHQQCMTIKSKQRNPSDWTVVQVSP